MVIPDVVNLDGVESVGKVRSSRDDDLRPFALAPVNHAAAVVLASRRQTAQVGPRSG